MLAQLDGLAERVEADEGQLARVLAEVGENFSNFALVARRQAGLRKQLQVHPEVVASVPEFESDIHDLPGLLRLGERIWA